MATAMKRQHPVTVTLSGARSFTHRRARIGTGFAKYRGAGATLRGLQSLGPLPSDGAPPAEPLTPVFGICREYWGCLASTGFTVHAGDLERAKALTGKSIEASRALGDRTGERVYRASLASIERGHRNPEPAGGSGAQLQVEREEPETANFLEFPRMRL